MVRIHPTVPISPASAILTRPALSRSYSPPHAAEYANVRHHRDGMPLRVKADRAFRQLWRHPGKGSWAPCRPHVLRDCSSRPALLEGISFHAASLAVFMAGMARPIVSRLMHRRASVQAMPSVSGASSVGCCSKVTNVEVRARNLRARLRSIRASPTISAARSQGKFHVRYFAPEASTRHAACRRACGFDGTDERLRLLAGAAAGLHP